MKLHKYKLSNTWHGNKGEGTKNVTAYERSHTVSFDGRQELFLTTGNPMHGDKNKLNPEDLLLASVSSCHLLSYLYLCAMDGVVVVEYVDNAKGLMEENPNGGGRFTEVVLSPVVTVADASMIDRAMELHHKAHEICYIANSVNFPVKNEASCVAAG
jgi:organic hydroperoxide reductase OsmC/OhrA